ncbi:hypothetical protein XBP1_930089 [Xenorhabdus bovienii str. puntauvense]|uniref:Uncharacterized protein n=1 Tax=Xenorhabdus bovienii str. puntauvense TaxID=1398201 RepID=A0A077NKQ8_XENBV|nr:hypothetical protein [Xenorhabdus bovienii]CDG99374.1 hypothetical protein XBP1_930089 [Xenorhabdus bovienii str. puntauvense]
MPNVTYLNDKDINSKNGSSYHDNSELGAYSNELSELSEKNKDNRGEYTKNKPKALEYPYNAISSPCRDKVLASEPLQETEIQFLMDKFKEGDILYGLDNPRAIVLADLAKAGFKRTSKSTVNSGKVFSGCVPFRRKTNNTKRNILIQNDITNATWDASKPREYATDKSIKKEVHDYERVINFREFLSKHPKYNVKDDTELVTALINNPSMTTSVPLWQKTSKAGLDYQLFVNKAPVHFLVDTIGDDINTVISKQGHGASITSSELRWLYRHKDTKEVKENLKFWRDGKAVPHSEIFADTKWSSYQPKHRYS